MHSLLKILLTLCVGILKALEILKGTLDHSKPLSQHQRTYLLDAMASIGFDCPCLSVCLCVHVLIDDGISTCGHIDIMDMYMLDI